MALIDRIQPLILTVRGQHVLIDGDPATLYGTTTKALNQAVKRNRDRFPRERGVNHTAVAGDSTLQIRQRRDTTTGRIETFAVGEREKGETFRRAAI